MAEPKKRGRFRARRRGRDILTPEFARELRRVLRRVQHSTTVTLIVLFLCSIVAAGVGVVSVGALG
ncbi:hypothetical protein [Jiangella asiatica]|uniref:Uncharacterized protein n=1 Tax=Jiangella asiatica TaxID=2530372 RepID=A0A4R5CKG8_9ACTN|nr:hypothetical protein [Jiangella asiatica]TDD98863.1 hypothetical protein E1269_28435 [Jiangella asiatica]